MIIATKWRQEYHRKRFPTALKWLFNMIKDGKYAGQTNTNFGEKVRVFYIEGLIKSRLCREPLLPPPPEMNNLYKSSSCPRTGFNCVQDWTSSILWVFSTSLWVQWQVLKRSNCNWKPESSRYENISFCAPIKGQSSLTPRCQFLSLLVSVPQHRMLTIGFFCDVLFYHSIFHDYIEIRRGGVMPRFLFSFIAFKSSGQ